MPPKRTHGRKTSKPPATVDGAMSDCDLPQSLMLCILTRLPVKSIYRFKSVCKAWGKVFSTPKFVKMHHEQLSRNPENQSIVIYSGCSKEGHHITSELRIGSNEREPISHGILFARRFASIVLVGCCNGLLCMAFYPIGHWIVMWNPALNMCENLPMPALVAKDPEMVSLGFGYDEVTDDFKVVRIAGLAKKKKMKKKAQKKRKILSLGVELWSSSSNSWRTIKAGFNFTVFGPKNAVIVNGNPYWVAEVDENEVLLCFDVRKTEFKVVPLPSFNPDGNVPFVDWNGSLAALLCSKNEERVFSLDLWVFDDGEDKWRKGRTFGPIESKVDRVLQCSKNGKKIVGECVDGKVFVFDPEDGVVEEIVIDAAEKRSFQIYAYTESLYGMKRMFRPRVRTEEEEKKAEVFIEGLFKYLSGLQVAEW